MANLGSWKADQGNQLQERSESMTAHSNDGSKVPMKLDATMLTERTKAVG